MHKTVRNMIGEIQREALSPQDMTPDRAAELLVRLTALLSNVNEEIREAEFLYAQVLLSCLASDEAANRAKIRAETTPSYLRKREARDTKELALELARSLKYFLKAKSDELQLSRHM